MDKLLLLDPPGQKRYLREYYCSKTSKTNYKLPPIDLIMLSGMLKEHYALVLLDAGINELTVEESIARIIEINPKIICSMIGAVSYSEDIEFFKNIKNKLPEVKIIVTGDCFMENGQELLEIENLIDAAILDFTNHDIIHYLNGDYTKIENMFYKDNGKYQLKMIPRHRRTEYSLPLPKHELFIDKRYNSPYDRQSPIMPILTDFGCPFPCKFCIISTLGFKYRPLEDVLEELDVLHKLGIKELFFFDQTFGVIKQRTIDLLKTMIEKKYKFTWCCFGRVDVATEEILQLMKKAGCHTIFWGVESADDAILKKNRKGFNVEQVRECFKWSRKAGLVNVGNFILGFPEDTDESIQATINLAKDLKCDYAVFHTAIPRQGTDLRHEALENKMISEKSVEMDQSGEYVVMGTKHLTAEDLLKWRKKAIRQFYFRISYLINRLLNIKTFYQLKNEIIQGINLLKTGR